MKLKQSKHDPSKKNPDTRQFDCTFTWKTNKHTKKLQIGNSTVKVLYGRTGFCN